MNTRQRRKAPARFTLAQLIARFGGTYAGDANQDVSGFSTLELARLDQLAFVTAPKYRDAVAASRAAAVLVAPADAATLDAMRERLWVCDDPYLQFARIAQWFDDANRIAPAAGVHERAEVHASARIDPTARVEAGAVVGEDADIGPRVIIGAGSVVGARCTIAAGSRLYPRVVVYPDCIIGARTIVHSGAVIGADGFGFAKDGREWVKIPQTGRVVIGADVEIGANTTIDRGALGDTVIGAGVKLDNQIQIAHNVRVGEHTIMAAFVGIAGSAIVGARCMIGGAARIMGHVTIADDVVVSTQTFVSRSITKAGQYTGYYPMSEHAAFEKNAAVLRRLDSLRDRVRALESATMGGTRSAEKNVEKSTEKNQPDSEGFV